MKRHLLHIRRTHIQFVRHWELVKNANERFIRSWLYNQLRPSLRPLYLCNIFLFFPPQLFRDIKIIVPLYITGVLNTWLPSIKGSSNQWDIAFTITETIRLQNEIGPISVGTYSTYHLQEILLHFNQKILLYSQGWYKFFWISLVKINWYYLNTASSP